MIELLFGTLWQGALIAAIAAGVLACVPTRHAATRYAVWYAALLALVLVPLAGMWHPAQPVAAVPATVIRVTATASNVAQDAARWNPSWIVVLWATGVLVCATRLLASHFSIVGIVRRASAATELGDDVFISRDLSTPIAARIIRPVVILPAQLVATLDHEDLRAVIQHERAHIRRFDIAGNLVQRVIESCLFFNPWVYLIGAQLIKEREAACDDWAVHASGDADRYASCLARLALARRLRTPLLTPSAIGSKRMLVARIARLLNGKVTQLKPNYAILGATIALFGVFAFVMQAPASAVDSSLYMSPKCNHEVKPLNAAMPQIPEADAQHSGEAEAFVTVGPSGMPQSAKIVKSSGYPGADKATVDAAMHSTYTPAMDKCKNVTGYYLFHVKFEPQKPH